jgi:hypothetical protein
VVRVPGDTAVAGSKLKDCANGALKVLGAQCREPTATIFATVKVCIHGLSPIRKEHSTHQKIEEHIMLVDMAQHTLALPLVYDVRFLLTQNSCQV